MTADPRFLDHVVLFVDDEEQARRYFPHLIGPEFQVRVASNITEAKAIAAEVGERLAVVVSDQRMPGGNGVDLLTALHRERPAVVRILTTAYADLASAVDAVNAGQVWRYVHKPWDKDDLRITITRAMELFLITRERDLLLREKLSSLRRLVVIDRVRSYAVLATGLANRLRNPLLALRAFLDLAPSPEAAAAVPGQVRWSDLLNMAQRESQAVLGIIQRVVEGTTRPDFAFTDGDPLAIAQRAAASMGAQISSPSSTAIPTVKLDQPAIERLFAILTRRAQTLSPQAKLDVSAEPREVWGAPGVRVQVRAPGAPWSAQRVQDSFLPQANTDDAVAMQADLLAAFFIAYHHCGDLLIRRGDTDGQPGFTIDLPCDPARTRLPELDPQWLEHMFSHLGE